MKIIDLDHFTPLKRKKLTRAEKITILKAYGYHCVARYCDVKLDIVNAEFHHRKPLNIGGTNELHNFAPLCPFHHEQLSAILASNLPPNSVAYAFVKLKLKPTCLRRNVSRKVARQQTREQLCLFKEVKK